MSLVARQGFRLWYRQPASKWLEALPLGNGRLGAMLWGGPRRERVDLNIDTLWSGGPRTVRPEGSAAVVAALRAAVLERRAYAGSRCARPSPAGLVQRRPTSRSGT